MKDIGPVCPEFPPLSQEYSRVMGLQTPVECGNAQEYVPKPPILFTRGYLGVKLSDALYWMFEGIDRRDEHPFDACRGITIRIHVGSYCHWVSNDSSKVEKILKRCGELWPRCVRARAGGWRPKRFVSRLNY